MGTTSLPGLLPSLSIAPGLLMVSIALLQTCRLARRPSRTRSVSPDGRGWVRARRPIYATDSVIVGLSRSLRYDSVSDNAEKPTSNAGVVHTERRERPPHTRDASPPPRA